MATPPATFVGRRRLLERLLRAAMPDDSQRIDLVTGVLGMGKSSLLLHAELLSSSPEGAFDAHYIDLEPYGDGGSGQGPPSFGAAVQDYELFSSFASAVMTRLAPHTLPKLDASRRAHQERFREVKTLILNVYALNQAGDNSQITSSGVTVNTEETPRNAVDATYIQESRTWIQEESDLLVEGLNSRDTARPALLLLDNVDAVLHRFFGVRLRVLLGRLNGVVVVLAQEPGAEAFYQGADTVPVPPLSESEVRELLEAELVAGPPQDALIPLVHSFSGGVPVAVKVLVDLLNDQDERLEVTDLRARLQRLPRDPESRLNEVVTTMEEHYRGRPLGIALRAASVPDRCNAPLLAKLLPVEGIAPEDAPDLLEDLAGLNVTTQSEGADYYVQIHPFIRRALLERMRKLRPVELGRYHSVIAEHYFADIIDAEQGDYGEMFSFEDPARQELLRQWLQHLGASATPQQSMLQAAKIFLDAMWWWGNYVEFDFCETLAADFCAGAEAAESREFKLFADAVQAFLTHYPFRARLRQDFDLSYPPAEWDIVQEQVFTLQELCGVLNMPPPTDPLKNHVKALTEVFLAHTYRYSSPPDHEEALLSYERAAQCFRLVERHWDRPWVTFESADLALEGRDISTARAKVDQAIDELYEQSDPEDEDADEELVANLHRLRADCSWQEGSILEAAREYGLAVQHSYLFHIVGGPPDDYTMQFYFEIRGRALQRLNDLWTQNQAQAMRAALEMQRTAWGRARRAVDEDAVREALREGKQADLALALFPRGPDVSELGQATSPFKRALFLFKRKVAEAAKRDLRPPTDPEPDP